MEMCARLKLPPHHALWLTRGGEHSDADELPVAWRQELRLLQNACISSLPQ